MRQTIKKDEEKTAVEMHYDIIDMVARDANAHGCSWGWGNAVARFLAWAAEADDCEWQRLYTLISGAAVRLQSLRARLLALHKEG